MGSDSLAIEIAEDLLYRTGQAFTTGNLSWLEDCFEVPQYLETVEGRVLIDSPETVREIGQSVIDYYTANGIVDMQRMVVAARFIRNDLVAYTHITRLIRDDGTLFRAPYPTYSVFALL